VFDFSKLILIKKQTQCRLTFSHMKKNLPLLPFRPDGIHSFHIEKGLHINIYLCIQELKLLSLAKASTLL